MQYLRSLTTLVLLCVWSYPYLSAQQTNQNEHIHIESAPEWVVNRAHTNAEFIPVDEITNGVYYQLLDNQIRVDAEGFRSSYSRYVDTIVNQSGVEYSSQLNFDFDPSYQKLMLNSLYVIRDGERINRLNQAKISVFSRETDLEKQIYSGQLTLNILLDDIQTGDTLDYSYTIQGANPVYRNIFSYKRSLNWSVPVYNQRLRVLWGKDTPLKVDTRNITPEIAKTSIGEFTEYEINLQNQKPLKMSNEVPYWYNPYGSVHFNETQNWQDVVSWAEPMYRFESNHLEIMRIAKEIEAAFTSPAEQISAALKYAQEEIRYVGLEMGINSHFPSAPEETLSLKYGDCKDKAVLLIAILDALKIPAYPALVDTDDTKLLAEIPPGVNLFNHVIVWLELNGKSYWLDPTLSNQDGSLDNTYQPDFGYALLLKQGQDQLTSMQRAQDDYYTIIEEKYDVPAEHDEPVSFSVKTRYKGYEAMRVLRRLEKNGKNKVAEDYEDYYQRLHPSLVRDQDLEIESNAESGVLTTDETFSIAEFWTMGDEHWEVDFYPSEIRNSVFSPKQVQRNAPLYFDFPNNIKKVVEIKFNESGWDFDPEEFTEDNDFFRYYTTVKYENQVLTLLYDYRSKTDNIPQDRIEDYLAARDRLREEAYYGILKYVKDESTESSSSKSSSENETTETEATDASEDDQFVKIIMWLMLIYAFGFICIVVDWQLEARRRPDFEGSHYYPISPAKFVYMSVITMGIYDAYWMYRNWRAIKANTEQAIASFIRGVFVVFWVFPLFLELKKGKDNLAEQRSIPNKWLIALFALVYLSLAVANALLDTFPWMLSFFVTPLLLLPLVKYIYDVNKQVPEASVFNSKWRVRHIATTVLFLPIILFMSLSQTPLIPKDAVVTESALMDRDLKYFYRQQILPPDEKIQYFYSDGFLSVRDDGNGFTDNRVFSYWKDDIQGLQKEIASFKDIQSIDVEFAESEPDNTIITITRNDNSNFLLFVTSTDKGDKLFVEELKSNWQLHKE